MTTLDLKFLLQLLGSREVLLARSLVDCLCHQDFRVFGLESELRQRLSEHFVGDALRFIYREFYNDMARPSFTQEIQYDLGISTIVGFKSAKLEILEATNTKISYQVISHFADF